jgi:hypothetical protein
LKINDIRRFGAQNGRQILGDPLSKILKGATNPDESVNFATRKLLAVPFVGRLIADRGRPARRRRFVADLALEGSQGREEPFVYLAI